MTRARGTLRITSRFIATIGTAIIVGGGALLTIGHRPEAADAIQAAAALVIGTGCGLLQRDLQALWKQPDISRHLGAADSRLRDRVADLQAALRYDATRPEGQLPADAPSIVASYAFDVEYAAYSTASLATAAENWPQTSGYLDEISRILDICEQVNKSTTVTNSELATALTRSQMALLQYRVPPTIRLRPEAQIGLIGRLREKAMQAGGLWPPVNS